MTRAALSALILATSIAWLGAQEVKPVPKDSLRVSIPGCAKGAVFTVGRRTADEPGSIDVAEGVHMHMNGPKAVMADLKLHQRSMIEITGIIRRNDLDPGGLSIGRVRIRPGPVPSVSSTPGAPRPEQVQIDVESWRQIPGECPGH